MTTDFKKYENAIAFRRALEDRLKNIGREQSIPLDRLRRRVTFDRFLARLFESNRPNQQWLLKGGYALEFRFHSVARTTKDIDFSIPHMKDPGENFVRELLQAEAKKDMKVKVMGIVNVTQRGNENDEFEKNISVIYLAKKNLLDQNQKLAQARDLLLPRLMSGKIKV